MGKKRDILEIWNDKGLLRANIYFLLKPTKDVAFPLNESDSEIIEDLIETYHAIPCAGIAANQIGYQKRIFVGYNPDENSERNYEIYINPQIISKDKDSTQTGSEGCLSIPFLTVSVTRFDKIKVSYFDQDGKLKEIMLERFLSRLFQHELDHLDGKIVFHRNPTDLMAMGETITESKIDDLFNIVDKELKKERTIICPFLHTERHFPFIGEKDYICTARDDSPSCKENAEIICKTIEHEECEYYDKRLIL